MLTTPKILGGCTYKYFSRRHPDSNWGIMDLQSTALPLGYVATLLIALNKYIKLYSTINFSRQKDF